TQFGERRQLLAGIQVPQNVVVFRGHKASAVRGDGEVPPRFGQFPMRQRTFRRGNLPEPHRTIFSAADEPPTVRREGQREDFILVTAEGRYLAPGFCVPQPNRLIATAGGEERAIGRKRQREKRRLIVREFAELLSAC